MHVILRLIIISLQLDTARHDSSLCLLSLSFFVRVYIFVCFAFNPSASC